MGYDGRIPNLGPYQETTHHSRHAVAPKFSYRKDYGPKDPKSWGSRTLRRHCVEVLEC